MGSEAADVRSRSPAAGLVALVAASSIGTMIVRPEAELRNIPAPGGGSGRRGRG
jgi:hypothetical protein